MSVRNFFIMVFMVVIFPIVIISYNADAFFIIISLILFLVALGNLHSLMAVEKAESQQVSDEEYEQEETEDMAAEVGQALGLNGKRLGYGFMISLDLVVIVYFIYAFFATDIILLKLLAVALITDWALDIIRVIHEMMNGAPEEDHEAHTWKDRLYELYLWGHNIATIGFIIAAFYFKFLY